VKVWRCQLSGELKSSNLLPQSPGKHRVQTKRSNSHIFTPLRERVYKILRSPTTDAIAQPASAQRPRLRAYLRPLPRRLWLSPIGGVRSLAPSAPACGGHTAQAAFANTCHRFSRFRVADRGRPIAVAGGVDQDMLLRPGCEKTARHARESKQRSTR